MKTIIKSSKTKNTYMIVCNNSECQCKFTFQDEDIFTVPFIDEGALRIIDYVDCPECEKCIRITKKEIFKR